MRKHFTSIRSRILMITVLITVIIGTVIASISVYVMSTYLTRNLLQSAQAGVSYASSAIDGNLNSVRNYLRSCQISGKVQDYSRSASADSALRISAHDYMEETYTANSVLRDYLIRTVLVPADREDIIQIVESAYSSNLINAEAIRSLDYFEDLRLNQSNPSIGIRCDDFIKSKRIDMIPAVYSVYHPYRSNEIGYIFAEFNLCTITDALSINSFGSNSSFYVQMGDYLYEYDGSTLVPSDEEFTSIRDLQSASQFRDMQITEIISSQTGRRNFCISTPLCIFDWSLILTLDTSVLTAQSSQYFALAIIGILIFSAIIFLIMYRFLSSTVTEPVDRLQRRIMRIEKGDFTRDEGTEWDNELGSIGRTINDLSENVLTLMNQRVEDERQKKDYEYKILQSQINPHFLYNTLNSIKWMATIQNATGIAEMTTALSRLLKDISKGTSTIVSIEHELSLVNEYFTVQQYRYGGTITLDTKVDEEELWHSKILRFSLQPLIENAIFHGIEPKGMIGAISIHVYRPASGGNNVKIDVTDNGVGIEEDKIATLFTDETASSSSFFKEIGLSNVHSRIKYEFGEEYGLSVASTPGEYTTVSILLPYEPIEL